MCACGCGHVHVQDKIYPCPIRSRKLLSTCLRHRCAPPSFQFRPARPFRCLRVRQARQRPVFLLLHRATLARSPTCRWVWVCVCGWVCGGVRERGRLCKRCTWEVIDLHVTYDMSGSSLSIFTRRGMYVDNREYRHVHVQSAHSCMHACIHTCIEICHAPVHRHTHIHA